MDPVNLFLIVIFAGLSLSVPELTWKVKHAHRFTWPTWDRKGIDGVEEGRLSVPFRRGNFHGLDVGAACHSGTQHSPVHG